MTKQPSLQRGPDMQPKHGKKPKDVIRPEDPKIVHHVVPRSWQKLFGSKTKPEQPYYLKIIKGKEPVPAKNPQGPGDKMAENYGNAIFDERGFQSNQLEDRYGKIETRLMPVLKDVIKTNKIDEAQIAEIAVFVAVQALRYPDVYEKRLERAKILAIEIAAARSEPDLASLNARVALNASAKEFSLTQEQFDEFKSQPAELLDAELEEIFYRDFRTEQGLNPNTILEASKPLSERLASFHWELVTPATQESLWLSDRPVPYDLTAPFGVALGPRLGLLVIPGKPATSGVLSARLASAWELQRLNVDTSVRAKEWICRPEPWDAG